MLDSDPRFHKLPHDMRCVDRQAGRQAGLWQLREQVPVRQWAPATTRDKGVEAELWLQHDLLVKTTGLA